MSQTAISRRFFLQASALAGATATLGAASGPQGATPPKEALETMMGVPFPKHDKVRIGVIGAGRRGQSVMSDLLNVPKVEIRAVCDIDPRQIELTKKRFVRKGLPEPRLYAKDARDYENLCKQDDLDFIFIATPWEWHTEMALCAMNQGKHVGVEVPAGVTLPQLWELVRTSERTRKHCMMMENCCYGDNEMMVLAMARQGLFGTITHGEAAYIHDLRMVMNEKDPEGRYVSEATWRRAWHTRENGNLYPTHGLGPVCWYMGVHQGDRLDSLVSMSSLEASLSEDQAVRFKGRGETFTCGDINTSILRTVKGRTILLQHDTVSPRPYTRHNMIQGTKGAFADYPERLYLDEVAKKTKKHAWIEGEEALKPYREQYVHELWKRVGDLARKNGGHGGMDYIMCYRVVECMLEGLAPDFNVYDAAAWSAPFPLSIASVKGGGSLQKIPDFTNGHWSGKA
ncbi:MAG: Gfo/Idh/MocA family oxidoreductase [Acidobacteria bacterium]|nr:Gfo/Idh/MocA family oxidoreductase [Acidobacteriota bacterium]MBI3488381.1 Gfo/Idh/MocA family oxidoreductase [Acidobacteriota bacterium]